MALVEQPKGGFLAVTSLTDPTVIIVGPTDPDHTLVVRSLVVVNVDNAASPVVSLGWDETGATPIVDADIKHFAHRRPVQDELSFEITNLLGSTPARRLYIVSNLDDAITVKWAGFEIFESGT